MWSVVSASLLALVASLVYLGIGTAFVRRRLDQDARPFSYFATYWFGIGTYGLLDSLWALSLVHLDPPLHVGHAVLHLKILAGVGGFWGLVAYTLTIYTGRDLLVPTAAGYAMIYAFVEHYYNWRDPIDQKLGTWGASLTYAHEHPAMWRIVVLLLFIPPLLSTIAYAFLIRATNDPAIRRRIGLTSLCLIAFLASTTLGWLNGHWAWWGLAEKVIALATALGVLAVIIPGRVAAQGSVPTDA